MKFASFVLGFSAVAFAEEAAVTRELGHKKAHLVATAAKPAFTYTKGHMHAQTAIDIPTIKGTTHIVPKEKGKEAIPVVVQAPTKKGVAVQVAPVKVQAYTPPRLTFATPVQTGKHGLLRNLHKKRAYAHGKHQVAAPMKAQPVVSKKQQVVQPVVTKKAQPVVVQQPIVTKKVQPVVVQQPIVTKKAAPQVVQVVAQPAKQPTYVVQAVGKGHHGHH